MRLRQAGGRSRGHERSSRPVLRAHQRVEPAACAQRPRRAGLAPHGARAATSGERQRGVDQHRLAGLQAAEFKEAVGSGSERNRRARSLDPLSAILNADLSEALSFAGQYDDALKQGEAAVALDPSFPLGHQVLARAYLGKRMFAEAIREAERAVELAPDSPWMQSYLAQMLAYDGRKREARLILKQLRRVVNTASSAVPAIYAALGDADAMFTELEKLYSGREGSLMLLNWEPAYASYRNDPRFRDLVRRIGLPSIDL